MIVIPYLVTGNDSDFWKTIMEGNTLPPTSYQLAPHPVWKIAKKQVFKTGPKADEKLEGHDLELPAFLRAIEWRPMMSLDRPMLAMLLNTAASLSEDGMVGIHRTWYPDHTISRMVPFLINSIEPKCLQFDYRSGFDDFEWGNRQGGHHLKWCPLIDQNEFNMLVWGNPSI